MIDLNAPIVPFESVGGIKLYSKLEDVYENVIKHEDDVKVHVNKWKLIFEIGQKVSLIFCNANGKLYGIVARDEYKGKLFDKIYPLMQADELLELEPSFEYEDWEEFYYSNKLGIQFKKDLQTGEAYDICITVKEKVTLEPHEFDEGKW